MSETETNVLSLDVPCDIDAPFRVRDALSGIEGFGWRLGDVLLVASELVTNALRHSGCNETEVIQVRVDRARGRVLISVCDPGASGMTARAAFPAELGTGGFGLWVVQQVARRWGAERRDGYRVWAELPLAAAA
jgi:anti-sigma regulatory factor (Ser/Thr protein kinase)